LRLIPNALRPSEIAKNRAQKLAKEAIKQKDNEEHKQVLEVLLEQARIALADNNHKKVATMLQGFILHDLMLRRIIDGQLMSKATVSENTLQKAIELQSYYNMARNNLLLPVIQVLTESYDFVITQINSDVSREIALEYYQYAIELHNFYMLSLEFLLQDDNTHELKIYQECMIFFKEVFDTAHEEVRLLLQSEPDHLEKTDIPVQPDEQEQLNQPDQSEQYDKSEQTEEQDSPEQSEQSNQLGKLEQTNKQIQPEQSEHSDEPEQTEEQDQSDQSDQPGQPD